MPAELSAFKILNFLLIKNRAIAMLTPTPASSVRIFAVCTGERRNRSCAAAGAVSNFGTECVGVCRPHIVGRLSLAFGHFYRSKSQPYQALRGGRSVMAQEILKTAKMRYSSAVGRPKKALELTTKSCLKAMTEKGNKSSASCCPHHRGAVLGSDSSRFTVRVFYAWSVSPSRRRACGVGRSRICRPADNRAWRRRDQPST